MPERRNSPTLWGSDPIAELLRALDIPYVALTPGASFRGLHDSLVNHLGGRPDLLLCLHEESAVAVAHGYAKVAGRPLAVALHSNVGLMHATMAIFNAWCDRVPILMIGAQGPLDAAQRRPWIDWVHTSRDLGALIRGYTKWDDQPISVPAALEAVLRAYRIATTAPPGPTYVCLDLSMQEQPIGAGVALPPLGRFPSAEPASPSVDAAIRVAQKLRAAERPVILVGRVSANRADWDRRVTLAERSGARVVTDLKNGARFPTSHPCHPHPPGLSLTQDSAATIRDADLILSLDWVDLGGALLLSCGGTWPMATVVQCSLDQYSHNGWSMDHQILPPADISLLADPDRLVAMLLDALGDHRRAPPATVPVPKVAPAAGAELGVAQMARVLTSVLAPHKPCWIRLPIGWPSECCDFADPLDYLGYDGAGGIGSGPGMAVGAALALRGGDRLPIAVIGDGDCLMGLTALWTATNMRIPLLLVVANNRSFFNDELHQERVARTRDRPIENRSVGLRLDDPAPDFAKLAEGQGATGMGPLRSAAELRAAVEAAVSAVRAGAVCVLDVHVAAEYAREASAGVLRELPRPAGH